MSESKPHRQVMPSQTKPSKRKTIGSRAAVFAGEADRTRAGLVKADLAETAKGKIIVIPSEKTPAARGTKEMVFAKQAKRTAGGLTKSDLMMNARGKVVSKKAHAAGQRLSTKKISPRDAQALKILNKVGTPAKAPSKRDAKALGLLNAIGSKSARPLPPGPPARRGAAKARRGPTLRMLSSEVDLSEAAANAVRLRLAGMRKEKLDRQAVDAKANAKIRTDEARIDRARKRDKKMKDLNILAVENVKTIKRRAAAAQLASDAELRRATQRGDSLLTQMRTRVANSDARGQLKIDKLQRTASRRESHMSNQLNDMDSRREAEAKANQTRFTALAKERHDTKAALMAESQKKQDILEELYSVGDRKNEKLKQLYGVLQTIELGRDRGSTTSASKAATQSAILAIHDEKAEYAGLIEELNAELSADARKAADLDRAERDAKEQEARDAIFDNAMQEQEAADLENSTRTAIPMFEDSQSEDDGDVESKTGDIDVGTGGISASAEPSESAGGADVNMFWSDADNTEYLESVEAAKIAEESRLARELEEVRVEALMNKSFRKLGVPAEPSTPPPGFKARRSRAGSADGASNESILDTFGRARSDSDDMFTVPQKVKKPLGELVVDASGNPTLEQPATAGPPSPSAPLLDISARVAEGLFGFGQHPAGFMQDLALRPFMHQRTRPSGARLNAMGAIAGAF